MFIIFIHNSTKKIGRVYRAIYENQIIYQHKNSKMWINLEIVDKWINLWIKGKKLCRIKGKKLSIDELLGFHYNSFRCLPRIRSLFGTFVRTNNSRRNDWWHWPYTKKREVSVCIREK